jgi:hypothetical protein
MAGSKVDARHGEGYSVREAVLVRTDSGSAWTVRFATEGNGEDVIVVIPPEQLEGMTFARFYSLEEIRALTEGRVHLTDVEPEGE